MSSLRGTLHLPEGVVVSTDDRGRQWRTAVVVELTRKTEARVVAILRHLLAAYDDVVSQDAPRREGGNWETKVCGGLGSSPLRTPSTGLSGERRRPSPRPAA